MARYQIRFILLKSNIALGLEIRLFCVLGGSCLTVCCISSYVEYGRGFSQFPYLSHLSRLIPIRFNTVNLLKPRAQS